MKQQSKGFRFLSEEVTAVNSDIDCDIDIKWKNTKIHFFLKYI